MRIAYYFAADADKETTAYFDALGADRLLSYVYDKSTIMRWDELMPSKKSRLFVDSGAFTAHTRGIDLDVDAYIEFVNTHDDKITLFAQVDVIPGDFGIPRTAEQVEEAAKKTWENYLYMRERVISPNKLIPVFHQGESFKWLENMLEWRSADNSKIPYIGISPSNDLTTSQKVEFIERCFEVIAKSTNPTVKTHAFGFTALPYLERYPFTSADSTSWKLAAAMGNIFTPNGVVRVSDRDYTKLCPATRRALEDYVSEQGFNLAELASSEYARRLFNVKFITDWLQRYERKQVGAKRQSLF